MRASATDVKRNFGMYVDQAQREPVTVEKTGRPRAVLLSYEDYQRLQAMEDYYWLQRAREAEKSGYLSPEESMAFLQGRLTEDEPADGGHEEE